MSKMMIGLWKSSGILSVKDFEVIQSRVDSFVCPSKVSRIPSKISSFFSGFTAEQCKNWTIYFPLMLSKESCIGIIRIAGCCLQKLAVVS